ncbi:MAG: hypothetical protein ABIP94_01675, partial [Planctomycetota bacterium]
MNILAKERRRHLFAACVAAVAVLLLVRCVSTPSTRSIDSIEACGQPFDVGTRVVRWHEPDGYDAYQRERFFTKDEVPDGKLRYTPLRGSIPDVMRERAATGGLSLADLQQVVHQFVLH